MHGTGLNWALGQGRFEVRVVRLLLLRKLSVLGRPFRACDLVGLEPRAALRSTLSFDSSHLWCLGDLLPKYEVPPILPSSQLKWRGVLF